MPVSDLYPEIALVVTALVGLLVVAFVPRTRGWVGAPIALAGLAASAALTLGQLDGPFHLTFSGTWALDAPTATARLAILGATALCVTLAPGWLATDRRHGEYYAVLLLSALGAVLLAGAADSMELVVAVLLSSATGYTLAAYHRAWPLSVEAGMKYFLIGALAGALLVTGVVLLFGLVGDTSYAATSARLAAAGPATAWGALAATALVVVGIGYKLGAFPAHAWMPDVAEGAPAPSAAFLTVVPKIGATVALARFVSLLPEEAVPWRALVAALAVVTMTLGNLAALWQSDLRRLVGWSSVSQSGYALVGVTVVGRSDLALPALIFFLAGYALANLAAFGAVAWLRGRTEMDGYRGLGRERPLAAAALVVSFLSLVGIPPLAGFVGKLGLFAAAIDGGFAWLAVVAVANTVVSLFYYLRVVGPMYFDPRPAPPEPVAVLGGTARWTMLAAAAALVALGLGAEGAFAVLGGLQLLP